MNELSAQIYGFVRSLMIESCLNVVFGILWETFTCCRESSRNGRSTLQESNCVCYLHFGFRRHQACVLFLEGFAVDFGHLGCSSGWIRAKDEIGLASKEVA